MADLRAARIDQDQPKLSDGRLNISGAAAVRHCLRVDDVTAIEHAIRCGVASRVRPTSLTQFTADAVPISTTSSENWPANIIPPPQVAVPRRQARQPGYGMRCRARVTTAATAAVRYRRQNRVCMDNGLRSNSRGRTWQNRDRRAIGPVRHCPRRQQERQTATPRCRGGKADATPPPLALLPRLGRDTSRRPGRRCARSHQYRG